MENPWRWRTEHTHNGARAGDQRQLERRVDHERGLSATVDWAGWARRSQNKERAPAVSGAAACLSSWPMLATSHVWWWQSAAVLRSSAVVGFHFPRKLRSWRPAPGVRSGTVVAPTLVLPIGHGVVLIVRASPAAPTHVHMCCTSPTPWTMLHSLAVAAPARWHEAACVPCRCSILDSAGTMAGTRANCTVQDAVPRFLCMYVAGHGSRKPSR